MAVLDMEGSDYTDATMDLAERLMEQHDNVGVALQAYLNALPPMSSDCSPTDLRSDWSRGLRRAGRDRLSLPVPRSMPTTWRLRSSSQDPPAGEARLCLGTHDVDLIEQISTMTAASGAEPAALQAHMLYGIREQELRRLRDAAIRLQPRRLWRSLVPLVYASPSGAPGQRHLRPAPADALAVRLRLRGSGCRQERPDRGGGC